MARFPSERIRLTKYGFAKSHGVALSFGMLTPLDDDEPHCPLVSADDAGPLVVTCRHHSMQRAPG
jgi:hypothetical protein